jgi:hypothetical protein
MRTSLLILPAALLALAACNRPPAEPVAPAAPVEQAVETVPEVDKNCDFCADPSFVRTCDVAQGVSTTLYWNLEDSGTEKVGLFVVDDAGLDSPFAEQPRAGSFQTGPWLKPGLTFKVKELDGTVLHTVVIEGKDC